MKFETKIKRVAELNERLEKYKQALKAVKKTSKLSPANLWRKSSLVSQIKKAFGIKIYYLDPTELKDLDFSEEFVQVVREYLEKAINRDLEEMRVLLNKKNI